MLVPREGDPAIVFPSEARYVGFHDAAWIDEKVFVDRPGDWLRERCAGAGRVGVYGLDYVMNVRDYRALAEGSLEVVPFDEAFDRARAVKSEAEMESVREAVSINEAGFWEVLRRLRARQDGGRDHGARPPPASSSSAPAAMR